MKKFRKILTIALVMTLVVSCMPVSAAPRNSSTFSNTRTFSFSDWFASIWDKYFGNNETETEETSDTVTTMTVIEDETTVENGDMLRASTYTLSSTSADESATPAIATYALNTADESGATYANSTTLKYFPVTLYDYDTDTINAATDALDDDLTIREGIYFSDGSPEYTVGADMSAFVDGEYYIQNIRASENNAGSWLSGGYSSITSKNDQEDATKWTLTNNDDGTIYLKNTSGRYLKIGNRENTDGLSYTAVALSLSAFGGNSSGVQIGQTIDGTTYYLCQWGSPTATEYGGYNVSNDGGNGMLFYPVVDGNVSTTPLAPGELDLISGYEEWNRWDKASSSANGQKMYTGLVQDTLDANKNIVFTKPEGGIFNSNTRVKDIYTGVEMPFVYEADENGVMYYTFDASQHGVYFYEDATQGSDGTAASNARLYFNANSTQSNGGSYADGSATVWAPFNSGTSFSTDDMNYHFGMQATIPFSMNPNGRIVATNDNSAPITFEFSGDDDVWIFIDGQLVVDLGGIHNKLDATINFATNTVTYSESNKLDTETGSYNDADFALEQTLFGNLIPQDRTSFAASDSHELTIFYLERGKGSSNSEIKFNLPVNDTLTVTKDATQSWNEAAQKVDRLTDSEQAIVDKIDFTFTLYRKTDDEGNYSEVANTTYYLLNSNGQVISTPATDANGKFVLKNGQSARFITTEMNDEDGVSYYVVEDAVAGFTEPDYNYDGMAANGFTVLDTGDSYDDASNIPELECYDENTASNKVNVRGSNESEDSYTIICSNFLDAELPNPSARPVEDKIVIDYGLPVEIDVLANDVYRGNEIELVSVNGAGVAVSEDGQEVSATGSAPVYGTTTIENGKIKYTLTKPLSGVEVLNYVVKVTGFVKQEATETVTTAYEMAVATVYIIPATSMYYEEDFSDLVTISSGTWDVVGTAQTDCQEPGVVGTVGDSPYGSDVAYLNDSGDSNGSSKYVSTESGAAQFKYTFTGTGTSFYARTTSNTGYMRVVITDSTGKSVYTLLRNTAYKAKADDTLYNIPVFTYEVDTYDTYTVTVTIAKKTLGSDKTTVVYGSDFWLDGIKVMRPLNAGDTNKSVAESAYATDAEANMSVETLRNKLLTDLTAYDENKNLIWSELDQANNNFVLFTDSDGAMTAASDYQSFGPKEEVYLNNGQKISFSLYDWDANTNKIYLGMKAPKGSGIAIVGGNSVPLNNAADCYYDITNYATITTDSEGIKTATFEIQAGTGSLISLTNIKVTGNAIFTIVTGKDEDNVVVDDEDADSEEDVIVE